MAHCSVLQRLQEVQFTLVELQFYLDMNPQDMRALQQYNYYAEQLAALKQEYERERGPLMQYGFSKAPSRWVWSTTAWPWEIEY